MPAANPFTRRASSRVSKRKLSSAIATDGDDTTALEAAIATSLVSAAAASAAAVASPVATSAGRRASSSTAMKPLAIDEEIAMEALSFVAVYADVESTADATVQQDEFWLAQLLDDVTHDMLETGSSTVRVTWLNRVGSSGDDNEADGNEDEEGDDSEDDGHSKKKKKKSEKPAKKASSSSKMNRFDYAFDDAVDVDTILCHVFALEGADGSLEITTKSLERIQRRLARAKAALANPYASDRDDDNDDVSEDEKPPSAARQRKQLVADDDQAPAKRSRISTSGGGRGNGGGTRARKAAVPKPKKLSKRDAARIIPPCYTTVDIGLHEDREIFGTHPFTSSKGDVIAANKDVIRAVLTKDYELLEQVTETPEILKQMSSHSADRSVDIEMTALMYAIQADDLKAVAQLLKTRAATRPVFASVPRNSLPQHSTGAHTSSFSDYNRRAINASRGGKEGNNALLQDLSIGNGQDLDDEKNFLWASPSSSLKMLTLFYPSGAWVDEDSVADRVAAVARSGNIVLLSKMVETLVRNDGWGLNDLHLRVLSLSNEALPKFRGKSVVKMSYDTKIQPLHFAAMNPNGRYLKQLWDALEEKPENSKDKAGFEPLHYAAVCESSDNLKFLIKNNRSLLSKTKKEKLTPLMCAIQAGREENAILLLDMAAENSEELLIQVMKARGPASFQAIHFAAQYGCLRVIERLLHHRAVINAPAGDKTSALCVAAKFGQFEAATTLLAHGAKVDLPDKLDKTPLIFAVKNGHTKLAALLINNGANVNAYDTSENSVAHYAASYGWLSCVELLASAGAEFWSRNSWGFVPLVCALLKQRSQCADYILDNDAHGRFLDFRDREGCTMLFLQCQHSNNLAQIEYLVGKGLNPNIPNAGGKYPLDVLIERASTPVSSAFCASAIEILLKNGALAQYETPKDSPRVWQPFHCAIRGKHVKIAEQLLNTGKVDPAVIESDGADAWLRAASMGDDGEPFLRLLLAHHNAHSSGGDKSPISFSSRVYGKHFFHVIAENYYYAEPTEMIAVEMIRECIARCPNVQELMNEKYNDLSPLLTLVSKERKAVDTLVLPREKAEVIKRADTMYSEVVRLYAAHTTDSEALIQYKSVKNPNFKEKTPIVIRNTTTTITTASGDVDMDGGEAEEEVEDEEPRFFTVKAQHILHIVCNRSLVTSPHSPLQKWYGEDILSIILEAFAFTQAEIDSVGADNFATPLLLTVQSRYIDGTRLLLANGANPDHSPLCCSECSSVQQPVSVSNCGLHQTLHSTALIYAINNNDTETVKLLLESGASPECFNGYEQLTPLHIVMVNSDVEMTECLLKHHADPMKKDKDGNTPLLRMIKLNRSISVKKPHDGEVSYTQKAVGLLIASSNTSTADLRKASIVEVALAYENVKDTLRVGDKDGRTALYFAAKNRDLPLLRALIQAHPDQATCANTRDAFGRTPLHVAINAVSMKADATFDVERFLLLAGADVNAVDDFKFSALHFALFKVDLDWHATYDARNCQTIAEQRRLGTYESIKEAASKELFGQIPAAETDPVETVSNLVAARGVNLLPEDLLRRTPIHLAAATGAFVCVSTLLSNLSSSTSRQRALEAKNANDFTPLACAFLHLRQTTITTLIQSNASVSDQLRLTRGVSIKSSKVRSFFYHAVKHSLAGIYHLLLNAKFSRRQAVEDAVLCGEFQLASNLIIGLEISNNSRSLGESNAELSETLMHCIARVNKPFDDLPRGVAWTLVENGVDLSHVNLKGNAAFHFAARNGNAHLMDFLLHHQCDINKKNVAGETPLMYALRKEQHDVDKCMGLVNYFLNVPSFDLHFKDANGRNVLLLILDLFISKFKQTDSHLFETVEALLKTDAKFHLLFQSQPHAWTEEYGAIDKADAVEAKTTTALLLITYVAPYFMRCELLRLFLKYNTKLTMTDANGNSVLMHLVAKNLKTEAKLVLNSSSIALNQRLQKKEIRAAVAQRNKLGQTPLHIVVQALEYGAFENHDIVALLIANGADLHATNSAQQSVLDCIKIQNSRALFRFLREQYPRVVAESEAAFFGDETTDDALMADAPPDFTSDAATYLAACDAAGKLKKTLVHQSVNRNCDVGTVSSVYCAVDETTNEPIAGEYYNVLLTKVDVKNGRFGVNAFYRMQVVHDALQEIYILFTNWGRIGESGKYQNTPFRTAADAVVEFKKVFRSKTANQWDQRRDAFKKKVGKYNLVQRVDFHTEIDPEITEPFNDRVTLADGAEPVDFAPLASSEQSPNLTQMLYAITDIRNLQLAAGQRCNYYDELPLAKKEELDAAITKLQEMLVVLEERKQVDAEIQELTGNISDEATTQLQLLSTKYSDLTEFISEKSSRYYEIMPVDERSFRSAIKGFEEPAQVNKELERLTLLAEITQTYKILLGAKLRQQVIHPLDYCRAALQVGISPLQADSQEKALLTKYFFRGIHKNKRKQYVVSNIFRVDRAGEKERLTELLEREPTLQHKPTQLLWHGTQRTNLMGIMAQGLRIAPPEVSHRGHSFGKGLYFGDVAQKSLDYCASAYVIEEQAVDAASGKAIVKRRHVHYMLLCEVALGTSTLANSPKHDKTITDGVDSIKAVGSHAPDLAQSVILPDCGVVVPIGRVSEPGVAYPIDRAWAIGKSATYSDVNDSLSANATRYLDKVTKDAKEGDEIAVDNNSKHLFINCYGGETLSIHVLKRGDDDDDAMIERGGTDISLRFTITKTVRSYGGASAFGSTATGFGGFGSTPTGFGGFGSTPTGFGGFGSTPTGFGGFGSTATGFRSSAFGGGGRTTTEEHHAFYVRRYRNVYFESPIGSGFTPTRPQHAMQYNELIVFKEAQARIRYLVEVELANH